MGQLLQLSTSGPALAALLNSLALAQQDFEGLLLGHLRWHTVCHQDDNHGEVRSEVLEGHIAAFCCCASVGSFFTGSGTIDAPKLAAMAARFEQPVIGWFTFRQNSTLQPSEREGSLTSQLLSALQDLHPQQPPPLALFGLMSRDLAHGGATSSFSHRFFCQPVSESRPDGHPSGALAPVRLAVTNLGCLHCHSEYRHAHHTAPLPLVPSLYPRLKPRGAAAAQSAHSLKDHSPQATSDPQQAQRAQRAQHSLNGVPASLHGLAVDDLRRQVKGVEDLFAQLIDQVASAAQQVSQHGAQVADAQTHLHTLYQELDWGK